MSEPEPLDVQVALEAMARDRVARFIFAVLGKLPREAVEDCQRAALEGARYGHTDRLHDSYCEGMTNHLLGGWALRELVNARVKELHAELQQERNAAVARVEVLERARSSLRYGLESLRRQIDEFEKVAFQAEHEGA